MSLCHTWSSPQTIDLKLLMSSVKSNVSCFAFNDSHDFSLKRSFDCVWSAFLDYLETDSRWACVERFSFYWMMFLWLVECWSYGFYALRGSVIVQFFFFVGLLSMEVGMRRVFVLLSSSIVFDGDATTDKMVSWFIALLICRPASSIIRSRHRSLVFES